MWVMNPTAWVLTSCCHHCSGCSHRPSTPGLRHAVDVDGAEGTAVRFRVHPADRNKWAPYGGEIRAYYVRSWPNCAAQGNRVGTGILLRVQVDFPPPYQPTQIGQLTYEHLANPISSGFLRDGGIAGYTSEFGGRVIAGCFTGSHCHVEWAGANGVDGDACGNHDVLGYMGP